MPLQKFPRFRVALSSFMAIAAVAIVQTANGSSIDCGYWTVNVKGGNYDEGDSVWWKSSVTFTHRGGRYTNNSGSTSSIADSSCMVNTNNGTCGVTLRSNGREKTCESPTLRIDTTPPTCGNWVISTSGYSNQSWTPGQDVSFLNWHWSTSQRNFSVSVSDSQSGVPSSTVAFTWPSDSNSGPQMQSNNATFALVDVVDNAGNATQCIGPRKRVDAFEPAMPTLDCDNFISGTRPLSNPYQGQVNCGLSDSGGPSKTYVEYRIKTYFANFVSGAIGGIESDTDWFANGSFDIILDANWNRIRSGTEYQTNSAPLRYVFTPKNERIVKIQGRICEFTGTPGKQCATSNEFEIIKLPPPPPIPETAGDGWYDCQNPNTGKIIWYSPDESIPGTNQTLVFYCSPDGTGTNEPKSRAKIGGTVPTAGSSGCWCWDNEAPTISTITASPATWTNQAVTFMGTAGNLTAGGSPYGGIQFSCDNGVTWSAGTTSSTASFTCDTVSASAQMAKVRACDQAKNCSATPSVNFFIEKTVPTVSSVTITGKKKNWNGHTNDGTETDSTEHTFKKDVSIALSPADSGGSGLSSVRYSCNPAFQDSGWENWTGGAGTKAFDVTDSGYGCNSSEGTKTVYVWAKDRAGNVSAAASASIVYDRTPPTFETYSLPILLRAAANYTYSAQNPSDGIGSGLKDYSYTWVSEPGVSSDFLNLASPSNNFGNLARYVNAYCDINDDGKCITTMRITVEDRAGNATTKEQRFEIIPSTIAAITGDVTLTSNRLASGMVADLYDRYSYDIHLKDANGNVIRPVPGILEIRGDYRFDNDASFLGNEKPVPDGNVVDGAVWYNWDDGNWLPSSDGNSKHKIYVGSSTRANGNYTLQVRSSVPTQQGYPNLTRNTLKIGSIRFSNALAAADAAGCPTGYVCTGSNANPSYGRSLGADLANDSNVNGLLSFKPALEVVPTKAWNDLSDSTWHDVGLTFKNNSTRHSFSPAKYGFDFRYDTYLGNFADMSVKGDFGNHTGIAEGSLKKISFLFSSGFSTVPAGGTVTKTIQIRANSHGLGFGKVGFTAYLPWLFENNSICDGTNCSAPVSTTGYNTANLDMASGVMAFDFLSAAVPTSGFGASQSYGQKFAANGQIADSGNNLMRTVESGIAVDSKTMDKNQFKTNIRKNVESMTASLPSDNGNNCGITLTSLTKDVYYYDFSKLSATPVNGNAGCVLTLKGLATGTPSGYRKLGVSGKKTIIVRGGNVYLDTDMHYANADSMLALVVLRDDGNRSKGGNVYVNPKVTNAVGAGYLEGSLISYDADIGKVYDADNTNEGELTRQFLWYGSLFSSNTIGGSLTSTSSWECPYGSDTYEATKSKSCTEAQSSRYDFAMLRRFILITVASTDSCHLAGTKSPKSTGTASEEYAFAGKKRCRSTDANDVPELRSTEKTAGFVMEYNSLMQTAGMKILAQ